MASKLDGKWLRLQIGQRGESIRSVAAKIGLDPGSFHRVLTGKRRIQANEVQALVRVLGLSLDEATEKLLGLPVHASVRVTAAAAANATPLGGHVLAPEGLVVFDGKDGATGPVALEIEGDAFLSGWRVVCLPDELGRVPGLGVDAGIVQTADGRKLVRKVRSGFSPGKFDLGPLFGFGAVETDVELVGIIPVTGLERA